MSRSDLQTSADTILAEAAAKIRAAVIQAASQLDQLGYSRSNRRLDLMQEGQTSVYGIKFVATAKEL